MDSTGNQGYGVGDPFNVSRKRKRIGWRFLVSLGLNLRPSKSLYQPQGEPLPIKVCDGFLQPDRERYVARRFWLAIAIAQSAGSGEAPAHSDNSPVVRSASRPPERAAPTQMIKGATLCSQKCHTFDSQLSPAWRQPPLHCLRRITCRSRFIAGSHLLC